MSKTLENKTALVTGSSRGIGRAIACRLAQEGAQVVIHYRANREQAEKTAEEVRSYGAKPLVFGADLRDPQQIKTLFCKIASGFGHLDILVSNAAMGALKPALALTYSKWDMTMEISTRAFLICAQEAVPLMKGRKGRIIAISSLGSRRYIPGYVAIGSAKAALESITRYLAVELAPQGITVNAVCGGLIETSTLNYFPNREQMIADSLSRTPMGRLGQPDDLADVVAFLSDRGSNWICGQTIVADGGFSLM
jgi:enoyl-[acyl-carrier protein] reductase III